MYMFEAFSQLVCILVQINTVKWRGEEKNKNFPAGVQGTAYLISILKCFEDECDLNIISTPNWTHWTGIMVVIEIEQEDFLSSVSDLLLRNCGDPP